MTPTCRVESFSGAGSVSSARLVVLWMYLLIQSISLAAQGIPHPHAWDDTAQVFDDYGDEKKMDLALTCAILFAKAA
jgi:hypothetical protein